MKNKYLSRSEKEYGLKQFLKHSTFNGFGISFLGDTPVFLMAIYFGATNLQLGYISSVIHMSGIILVFLPTLLNGINIVKVQYRAWLVRGIICLFYAFLFFLKGQSAVIFILVLFTLFCITRMFGMAVAEPVQQMLTTPTNVGEVVISMTNRFHFSRLLSNLTSFIILSIKVLAGIPGLLVVIFIGIVSNTIAAVYLKRIPSREVVEYRKGNNIFRMFLIAMQQKETRMVLIAKWISLSILILFGFIVPFLSKVIRLPYNYIFLYTIAGSLSTVIVGLLAKPFVDRIGSKSMIIFSSFCIGILGFVWAVLPATTSVLILFPLSFLNMFFLGMVLILIGRLFLKSIPENNKITFSSMANFFSAIIALVTGLCGGLLIDIAENFQFYLLNSYGLVFISIFILSFCNGIVCCFLKEKGSLSVKETAQVLFSTKNLRAYLDVYHFYQTKDPIKKKSILIHIANSDADLATSEIGKILKNPLSNEKREALKSLFLHPRLPLLPEVIREAKDPNALHRIIAIFALGGFEGKETEQTLIDLLDDSDMRVKSTAAKSLARVGNQSEFDKILKLSKEPAINIQEKLDFFIAIYIMDDEGVCLKNVFDDIKMEQNSTFIQTYLSLVAKMLELDPALADIFEKENCQNKSGFSAVLQEAKQLQVFDRDTKLINSLLNHQQYQKIFQWAGEVLKNTDFYGKTHFLKEAILSVEEDKMSKDLSLAVLYFLYQMLLASE